MGKKERGPEAASKDAFEAGYGESDAERLMAALNVMADAFCYYDRDDRLILYNEAFPSMYAGLADFIRPGVTFTEMVDQGLERGLWVIDPLSPEAWRQTVLDSRREAQTQSHMHLADGRWILHREIATDDGGRMGISTDISALKRDEAAVSAAAEEAKAARERLQTAIDAIDDGFVLWDRDDRLVACNRAFRRQFAFLPNLREGRSFSELFLDFARTGLVKDAVGREEEWVAEHAAARMEELDQEIVFQTHDGRWMLRRDTLTPTGDRVGIRTDITELKKREAGIERAEEQARQLLSDLKRALDAMRMGVVILDADMKAEIINTAFYEIWHISPADVQAGSPFRDMLEINRDKGIYAVADEDWNAYVDGRLREIATGDVAPREFLRADGRTLIYSVTTLSGGKRLVCYYDVTEMKRQQGEAEQSRKRLADVLESLPAGVVIYDQDDRFVLANRKIQESLPGIREVMRPGLPLRAAVETAHDNNYFRDSGDPALDRIYDTDREAWIEGYLEKYYAGHSVTERRHPDGRWFQVYDTRTPDGSYVGVRVDITDIKNREVELREAQCKAVLADRAKSEFLANMSHEIRTPMNGVLGMAELLAKSDLDAKQRTFTDIIVKSGNALLTIINDILDFSKIDAGQLVLDAAPFHLAEAIEDVATLVSTRAKEKDLELIVRVDPSLPDMVTGDVGRIRQIVTNLTGNAVKFTDAGHVLIDVSGSSENGMARLRVSVTDTGMGIPEEKLALIFEKFSQVDASSTRRHEGTGLGLAITSRLVELMGGEIGVESKEGKGSTFWFTIDLPDAGGVRPGSTTPLDVTGARVLIVDDNAVNRSILLEQMTSWSFDACAAESGEEGLAVLDAASRLGVAVDCVILDYQMPRMTGAEMARIVRASQAYGDTPIVMLTSVDQSLSNLRYRELAIAAQLIKPARSSALLETVVTAIQRRRAAPAQAQASAPSVEAPARLQPPRPRRPAATDRLDVLVAEDNEVNQLVFTQILAETGLVFEIVGNGRLALEAARKRSPRMILMDVSMPEMNGLEATAAIREEEAGGRRVPIVGVTAHALKGDRERCIEAGMDDYLSKPISPKALQDKIDLWLARGEDKDRASA